MIKTIKINKKDVDIRFEEDNVIFTYDEDSVIKPTFYEKLKEISKDVDNWPSWKQNSLRHPSTDTVSKTN